jgi:hypothetical protein
MNRTIRILTWTLGLCCLSAMAAEPAGQAPDDQPGLRPMSRQVQSLGTPLRWRLMGDHYFAPDLGLRASGGLLIGVTGTSGVRLGSTSRRAMPYVGLGYSTGGLSANRWGGWGLSADIGLQASQGGDWPLGRALESPAGMGDLLRELRLTPVLQLGVSYAF